MHVEEKQCLWRNLLHDQRDVGLGHVAKAGL